MSTEPPARPKAWYEGPSFWMLVVLIAFYLVSGLTKERSTASALTNLLAIGVVLLGLRALTQKRRIVWVGAGLLLVAALTSVVLHEVLAVDDYRWDTLAVLVLFLFMAGVMAGVVFKSELITVDKIFAAACVYMLMGICFGLIFVLIEQTAPGSFSLSEMDRENLGGSLVHFSFTTLTTVGYGNISPLSSSSRSLADMEAVLAQLYLAVVLARLVSLQITHQYRSDQ